MVRTPCCKAELGLKKGAWTPEEDQKLLSYLNRHGEGGWRTLPEKAGISYFILFLFRHFGIFNVGPLLVIIAQLLN